MDRTWVLATVAVVVLASSVLLEWELAHPPAPGPEVLSSALNESAGQQGSLSYPPAVWVEMISISVTSPNLQIDDLSFSVRNSEGQNVTLPGGSTVEVVRQPSGVPLANHTFSSGAWSGAPPETILTSSDVFEVFWNQPANDDPFEGDILVTAGSNGFTGTVVSDLG